MRIVEPIQGHINVTMNVKERKNVDLGGSVIEIVTDYDPFNVLHCVQEGIVCGVPRDGSAEVQVGDKVYIHHTSFEKRVPHADGDVFQIPNEFVYAYERDGVKKTVKGWNYVEPIKEELEDTKENGIYVKHIPEELGSYGYAWLIDDELSENGVEQGDLIWFLPNRNYAMYIGEKLYFRIRTKDIAAKCFV